MPEIEYKNLVAEKDSNGNSKDDSTTASSSSAAAGETTAAQSTKEDETRVNSRLTGGGVLEDRRDVDAESITGKCLFFVVVVVVIIVLFICFLCLGFSYFCQIFDFISMICIYQY